MKKVSKTETQNQKTPSNNKPPKGDEDYSSDEDYCSTDKRKSTGGPPIDFNDLNLLQNKELAMNMLQEMGCILTSSQNDSNASYHCSRGGRKTIASRRHR